MARQNIRDDDICEDEEGCLVLVHPDRELLGIKFGLLNQIQATVKRLGLTQKEAGKRLGITQPKVSRLLKSDVSDLSERKLMDCLNRLGYDIVVIVSRSAASCGSLTFVSPEPTDKDD